MVSFPILLTSAKNGVTKKVCESTLIALVIIHTKFQLHWMFETKVKWVRHFANLILFNTSRYTKTESNIKKTH